MRTAIAAVLCWLAAPGAAAANPLRAEVAGRVYNVPHAMLNEVFDTVQTLSQAFDILVVWPGLSAAAAGASRGYEDGVMAIGVQDISATSRVEQIASAPGGERGRFLTLWRDSTVDQFALPASFTLEQTELAVTPSAAALGLKQLTSRGLIPGNRHLYADDSPPRLTVIMMCEDELSCQLWWTQDDAAVEVTFGIALLPQWPVIHARVGEALRRMQAP